MLQHWKEERIRSCWRNRAVCSYLTPWWKTTWVVQAFANVPSCLFSINKLPRTTRKTFLRSGPTLIKFNKNRCGGSWWWNPAPRSWRNSSCWIAGLRPPTNTDVLQDLFLLSILVKSALLIAIRLPSSNILRVNLKGMPVAFQSSTETLPSSLYGSRLLALYFSSRGLLPPPTPGD